MIASIQSINGATGRPARWRAFSRWQMRCVLAVAGSIFVAVCAHVAVPIPHTPVPFTLQPFAVLLVGMALGPCTGFVVMATYLMEGALGMPVFTPAGAPGIARLLGPTGGYLFAYPLAAALAGWIGTAGRRFWAYVLGGSLAMLLVYFSGAAWFSYLLHLPFRSALNGAVLPFVAPDAVKVLVAAGMAQTLQRTVKNNRTARQGFEFKI